MKRGLIILLVVIITLSAGCTIEKENPKDITADMISIYYGASSYAFFTSEEGMDSAIVEELVDSYKRLSLEPSDKKIDIATMYHIVFMNQGEIVASISVDENGVFWLNGKTDTYRQNGGDFHYSRIAEIYNNSKVKN